MEECDEQCKTNSSVREASGRGYAILESHRHRRVSSLISGNKVYKEHAACSGSRQRALPVAICIVAYSAAAVYVEKFQLTGVACRPKLE
jgi:hypothetical protein